MSASSKYRPQQTTSATGQKTPYQGPNRVFGLFKCPKCKLQWKSGHSYANQGLKCKRCKILVYPYEQRPLGKSEPASNDSTQTPEEKWDKRKCGKCRRLGYPCGQFQCGRRNLT